MYDNSVYEKVSEHSNKYHNKRCCLLRTDFSEAISYFSDNTIDIIHIDGLHTYEAVKKDLPSGSQN